MGGQDPAVRANFADALQQVILAMDFKIVQPTIQQVARRQLAAKGDDLGHDPVIGFNLQLFEIIAQPFDDNAEQRSGGGFVKLGVSGNGGHFAQQPDVVFFIVTVFQVGVHERIGNLARQFSYFLRIRGPGLHSGPFLAVK